MVVESYSYVRIAGQVNPLHPIDLSLDYAIDVIIAFKSAYLPPELMMDSDRVRNVL